MTRNAQPLKIETPLLLRQPCFSFLGPKDIERLIPEFYEYQEQPPLGAGTILKKMVLARSRSH
jgi:hypothetical protein